MLSNLTAQLAGVNAKDQLLVEEDRLDGLCSLSVEALQSLLLNERFQAGLYQEPGLVEGACIQEGHQEVAVGENRVVHQVVHGAGLVDVLLEPFVHVVGGKVDEHRAAANQ